MEASILKIKACVQFEEEADLLLAVVVSVVELDEARVAQRFHDFHFALHVETVGLLCRLDELGGQPQVGPFLAALVHCPELSPVTNRLS